MISYRNDVTNDLKVASCNDPACAGEDETLSTVDPGGIFAESTSLAIGLDGNPVISYGYGVTSRGLKVARCNDPACAGDDETLSIVDSGDGSDTSLAIGTDGNAIISYYESSPQSNLKVARASISGN